MHSLKKIDFRKRQKRRRRKRLTFQSCQRSIGENTIKNIFAKNLNHNIFLPCRSGGIDIGIDISDEKPGN